MRLYKSTRICLEGKSEEFEKVGVYSHENEYNNSAVSRYYYSMFIRVSYIYKGVSGSTSVGLNSHQKVLNQLKRWIEEIFAKKQYSDLEIGKKISELFIRLELCCNYRNIADYKEGELTQNNVNYLKKTLLLFNNLYEIILEICGIIKKERDDM